MKGLDGLDLLLLVGFILILWTFWPRKPAPLPECFGDFPHRHPQDAAERDCHNCRHAMDCHEETPHNAR